MTTAKEIAKLALSDRRFTEQFIPAFLEAYYSSDKNVVVIEDENRVIGFAHYWMVTDSSLDKLRDLEFSPEKMKKVVSKRGLNLHIISIVIDKTYRNNGLIFKMKDRLKEMEPQAETWSWLTPDMRRLVIKKIVR